jgi:hypothetical protein
MIVIDIILEGGNLELGIGGGRKLEEECMKGLVLNACSVKDSRRIRWDSGLVIRSRGRWGKCG